MKYNEKLMPSRTSPIWLNKRIRIWTGIRNNLDNEIHYFNHGIFALSKGGIELSNSEDKITIKGLDKMALMDGTISGELKDVKTVIPAGVLIHEAIRSTASTLGLEVKLLIDDHPHATPYKIERQAGDTVWSILEELTGLYMNWQCYYDVNGFLNFNQRVPKSAKLSDPIMWDFTETNISIDFSTDIDFDNIKNSYVIRGRIDDETGIQAIAIYEIRDVNEPNSPFTIEKLKEERIFVKTEEKYFDDEACRQCLEYEKFKHTNFNERISFTCVPIYFLDVNHVIACKSSESNETAKYVIDSIDFGLKHDSPMNISGYKLY